MSQTGLTKGLVLVVVALVGATTLHGGARDLELIPAPAPAVVPGGVPHVVHEACCVETCGHCAPDTHHKYRLSARRALKCEGSIELCMHVVNPACCGRPVEIPMCVPACCAGQAPIVNHGQGLFGRGVVCIEWPCCGYSARVVFKHNGKIDVNYTAQ